MELEKAKEILYKYLNFNEINGTGNFKEAIKVVLKELDKKDKTKE
jgi:hypothetical protein